MLDEKQFKKIKEITIPEYIYQIKLSESRRVKYFSNKTGRGRVKKEIEDLPKKHKVIGTDLEGFYLGLDNNRIIANPKAAGTSKYVAINSQLLYSSSGQFTRAKVMKELHAYWVNIFKNHAPFVKQEYPLAIHIDWYCTKEHKTQDIDNFTYIIEKSMFDGLQEAEMIPDDTVDYICGQSTLFHEIEDFSQRKLVISFYTYTAPNQLKVL
jgi:Holliday junction resolvase RusA-like endonuclease